MYRTLAAVLFGFSLLLQFPTVFADNTPYPARLVFQGVTWAGTGGPINARNEREACEWVISVLSFPANFQYIGFTYEAGYSRGGCTIRDLTSNNSPDTWTWPNAWHRYTDCDKGGSVTSTFSDARPMCSCPADQMFPPGGPVWGGPVCVPATCPVEPLPVYSPDPYPLDIANLAPRMQTALQCLQAAIGRQTSPGGNPGTSTVDSAYRPSSYNRHLQEVWDKWMRELIEDDRPECQSLRTEVRNHFNLHGLIPNASARPHTNSAHTRGQAFDLSSNLYDGVLDVLAVDCNVVRSDPLGDPPHFIHR